MVLVNKNFLSIRRYNRVSGYDATLDHKIHNDLHNSKLFQYYKNYTNNNTPDCILTSIISNNKNAIKNNDNNNIYQARIWKGYAYILWKIYCKLMKHSMFDIIEEIISNNSADIACDDFMAICLAAIDTDCVNIINALLNINFDINCIIVINELNMNTNCNQYERIQTQNNPKYINNSITIQTNAFGYAVEFGTLNMVKYLVENGSIPKIIDDGVLKLCNNISIFDYVLSIINTNDYIIDILNCFFCGNTSKNYYKRDKRDKRDKKELIVEKIKVILDYCDISMFNTYINDQFGCSRVHIIQLLEHQGIIFDWVKLLHAACCHDNTKLITYILDKNVVPAKETIEYVFNNVRKETIVLFAKYKIDLSIINEKYDNDDNYHNKYHELDKQLEECGLHHNAVISCLMNYSRSNVYVYREYNPKFDLDINSSIELNQY